MSADLAARFLDLHRPGAPLLMPNPWDVGSARLLTYLGFQALATTSSGFAATRGGADGTVSREDAIAHGGELAAAVDVPVSADLENGFGHDPATVASTVEAALAAGLAGCSIEDYTRRADDPIYPIEQALERIEAAVTAGGGDRIVLTARAENFLHGVRDLPATIERLQRYAEAGAQVVYAPGLTDAEDIRAVVESVPVPVNVLLRPQGPGVAQLAGLGVARISVGGAFAKVGYGAVVAAAEELRAGEPPYRFWETAARGGEALDASLARSG